MRIHWSVEGSGPPLLLIHGLGYDGDGWGPVLPLLQERFTVLRFDNRGVGRSDAPRGPYTVRLLTEDARGVLREAGIPRAHVLGISLGGAVAQELAAVTPELVDRLVLAATTPGGFGSHGPPAPLLRLLAQAATLDRSALIRRLVENALGPSAPPRIVDEILAYRRVAPPRLGPWLSQAAAGVWFGFTGRSGPIAAPTLVVNGGADRVVDPRNGDRLAAGIPGAKHIVFADAGHLLPWEEPERFAEVVADFLTA